MYIFDTISLKLRLLCFRFLINFKASFYFRFDLKNIARANHAR